MSTAFDLELVNYQWRPITRKNSLYTEHGTAMCLSVRCWGVMVT